MIGKLGPAWITAMSTLWVGAAPASAADGNDPASVLECRSAISGFTALAEPATQGAPPAGWTRIEGANPLLIEFRLARPLRAFGRTTSHIAFASSALLAVFDEPDPTALAGALGIVDQVPGRSKFLGERLVSETVETDTALGSRFVTRTALNLSTVDTHPGKVLAGCSYRVDIEDL